MEKELTDLLQQFRDELERDLGSNLERLVLYGSRARGDEMPDSDADVLVVLMDASHGIRQKDCGMKKVTTKNYMKEKCYPRVVRVVSEILAEKDVVTPIEVFVRLDLLKPSMVEEWRFNRIPSLEKAIQCNLSNACRILRVLRLHSLARGLKPSRTDYRKWGKGRRIPLRFSKFGDPNLEAAYSTHYLSSRLANAKARPDGFATSPAGSGPVVPNDTADSARRAIQDEERAGIPSVSEMKP